MTPAAAATASRSTLEHRTESLQDWAKLYTRELSIAGVILVALIGVLWLYRYSSRQQVQRADAQLQRHAIAARSPLGTSPLTRRPISSASSPVRRARPRATRASMILAETYYAQGKYVDGLSTLQTAPRSGASAGAICAWRRSAPR